MRNRSESIKQRIFSMDNIATRGLSRIFDLIILNFLFIISCLPIVTIGPALISLYKTIRVLHESNINHVGLEFFLQFKKNLKQGFFLGLLGEFFIIVFLVNTNIFINMENILGEILLMSNYGIGFVLLSIGMYAFQVSGKSKFTINQILINSFYLSFLYILKTLLLVSSLLIVFILSFLSSITMLLTFISLLFIGFSLIAYSQVLLLNPILEKYNCL